MTGRFKFRIIIFVVTVMVIICLLVVYFFRYNLDFKEVYSVKYDGGFKTNSPCFICIKDPNYNGFFDKDFLKQYDVVYTNWNFENHTYIVTFGYELKRVSFTFSKCVDSKKSIIPANYQALVTLSKERNEKIHIYELDRIDLESSFPDGTDEIVFQD